MNLPAPLRPMVAALSRGAKPRLVGGCVRDWLLGLEPKDFDIEVYGMGWDELAATLAPFGPTDIVGRSFGVIKVRADGQEYDFSLPRRETKVSAGHRGFAVEADSMLDERAASARRDFTINAILFDPIQGRLIDWHGGAADLKKRVLRHVSPAFVEDPLRVLRAFQLAARFDLTLAPETAALCASISATFADLPRERIWGEWDKFVTKAVAPRRGLAALNETGWLCHFPEIAALDGLPQEPAWHPEGDVFTHTGHALDALVVGAAWQAAGLEDRRILSLSVLCHDLGKALKTARVEHDGRLRWVSPGHDRAGGPLTESFLERIGSPLELRPVVHSLVEHHHAHQSWPLEGPSDTAIRRLARRLAPASIDQLVVVMEADHRGRPPLLSAETTLRIAALRERARELSLEREPPRPILQGRDLVALGREPGPEFGKILRAAFEAQLDGAFADHPSGMSWLRAFLEKGSNPYV